MDFLEEEHEKSYHQICSNTQKCNRKRCIKIHIFGSSFQKGHLNDAKMKRAKLILLQVIAKCGCTRFFATCMVSCVCILSER